MQTEVLLELPDEALYHLLLTMEVEDILRTRQVFGRRRSEVFATVERYFQNKYHLPGLSLERIARIISQKTAEDSLSKALRFGDYPGYALSLYDELEEPFDGVEKALIEGREETAIALLKKNPGHLGFFFYLALNYHSASFLRYLLTLKEFSLLLREALSDGRVHDHDVNWALGVVRPEVNERFITIILGNMVYVPDFFEMLLTLPTDEELLKAEHVHQQADVTGINPLGGDYYHGNTPSEFFHAEKERRGL